MERLVQRLTANGKREIFFQGKPIGLAQGPAREDAGGAEITADTVPRSKLAEEVGRRIDRRLSDQVRLALWLQVSETDPARAAARDVKRVLETKPLLVLSAQIIAGTTPVPSGVPGGHVNMLLYAFEPHPDVVLAIYKMGGRLCVSERDGCPLELDTLRATALARRHEAGCGSIASITTVSRYSGPRVNRKLRFPQGCWYV